MGFCISEIPLKVPVLVTHERSHMYSEGSFRGSGSSGQVNGATFVLLTHGRTALSAALGSCPCPCFLQRIRRLKACFPIRLKQTKSQQLPSLEEIHGNQFCCPSEPQRAGRDSRREKSFCAAGEVPIQSKAGQKMGPGKSGCCPQGFRVPRVGPASCQTSQFQHWESCGFCMAWAATQGLWFWRFLSRAA